MTIGKKMGLGFGVLLALVVTLAVVVLFNLADMNRQFSFVIEHDAQVIANARHLSKLVVDMETGQRGFGARISPAPAKMGDCGPC